MSVEIRVFINKRDMLSIEQWNSAILEYRFDLKFNCELDVFEDSGFISMVYKNEACGFEYGFDSLKDTMFSVEENPEIIGKDIMVSFSSSYEQADLSSAIIVSAILAKKCTGIYWVMNNFKLDNDPVMLAKEFEESGIN